MTTASAKDAVRILPNNKVYRQLFDAQVQLSETYNRVRDNQLSQPVHIVTHPDATPLVRNIRPHEPRKREWLSSLPNDSDAKANPITIFFYDEKAKRENEQQRELDEMREEVFNLPDNIVRVDEIVGDPTDKESVTTRLAATRQAKFEHLWNEFLDKIAELNQNLVKKLEELTRDCNAFYEQGHQDIDDRLQTMIYEKELTSLTSDSFGRAFGELDALLTPRFAQIQGYCQSMDELEMERIRQIRDLFKYYSERLYKIHHLSDQATADQLERQAKELNSHIIDNRRIYAELEARLLSGETDRVHRHRTELVDHENQWRDAMWIIHKQTWISKLSQRKAKLEYTIASSCEPVGSDIADGTRRFVEHVHSLNAFIPPMSTKDNAHKWVRQGRDILDTLIDRRNDLLRQIKQIIRNELDFLGKESSTIREKVLHTNVYDEEEARVAFQRDIEPLLEERQQYLQTAFVDRLEAVYERLTRSMYHILDRLAAYIQSPAEQWDTHQAQLEQVTEKLLDMMRECRRPHDLQNEKKLAKLDSTLDEMRSAPNATILARLLTSANEQLNTIKASYSQFYDMEHAIVNKYAAMIAEEVRRYKAQMLDYFHARETHGNDRPSHASLDSEHQIYTTSIARTTYELQSITDDDDDAEHVQKVTSMLMDEESTAPMASSHFNDRRGHVSSYNDDQLQSQTFLTDETSSIERKMSVPFYRSFQIPSNLVQSMIFNLSRAFLDHYDQWHDETARRADAVMFSKHDELDKEMDFQMHLHEPRRQRIENDVHKVRAAELALHDERVDRHTRGIREKLQLTDSDYHSMLNDFTKSVMTYKEEIFALEPLFVNATTAGRLASLQERLTKKRDVFMDHVRTVLRNFRQSFDNTIQHLRESNVTFRKSFKMFSEGGNFSREEIELYRKKLEKAAIQIDKAETEILKEMEKLEKRQLEEATKIMTQFQDRFKNHLMDLQFIEVSNRWISETQVKIKTEVAANNQGAQTLKTLVHTYHSQIDSILNPHLDKQVSTLDEIKDSFHQIAMTSYERALYLKCLVNELLIPASMVTTLKNKGLLSEEELVNDLAAASNTDESVIVRRASKLHASGTGHPEESKSVKFATSAPRTRPSPSPDKADSTAAPGLAVGPLVEEANALSTIRTLLHKSDKVESDEIVESGLSGNLGANARSHPSLSSSRSSQTKLLTPKSKNRSSSARGSSTGGTSSASRRDRSGRARTRDEIFALYCTFGETPHSGQDFLSKILNILREATEGLLTHAEIYYREKGSRPSTRPQALREKFDEYAQSMLEKLKGYDDQCRSYHENSVNEFRDELESFERSASLMVKLELDGQIHQAEQVLIALKQQFDTALENRLAETQQEEVNHFEQLRPTLGHPARKNDLQDIDNLEKTRLSSLEQLVQQLRSNSTKEMQVNAQQTIQTLATSAERLLILFDDILTADEIIRTKLPPLKQPLGELVRRQQSGRPLDETQSAPLLERKQGHWPGLSLTDPLFNSQAESKVRKQRSTAAAQRQKTSAAIVTQKTTLPQVETIVRRDHEYQRYKDLFAETAAHIDKRCASTQTDLERQRSHWNASIDRLKQLRPC